MVYSNYGSLAGRRFVTSETSGIEAFSDGVFAIAPRAW
jgi:hypothetical protein